MLSQKEVQKSISPTVRLGTVKIKLFEVSWFSTMCLHYQQTQNHKNIAQLYQNHFKI